MDTKNSLVQKLNLKAFFLYFVLTINFFVINILVAKDKDLVEDTLTEAKESSGFIPMPQWQSLPPKPKNTTYFISSQIQSSMITANPTEQKVASFENKHEISGSNAEVENESISEKGSIANVKKEKSGFWNGLKKLAKKTKVKKRGKKPKSSKKYSEKSLDEPLFKNNDR